MSHYQALLRQMTQRNMQSMPVAFAADKELPEEVDEDVDGMAEIISDTPKRKVVVEYFRDLVTALEEDDE